MGFEMSDLYDPVHFSSVTILGQLLITDLLEKLERYIELIQSNTDGIFFRLRDGSPEALEHCRKIVNRYEQRTHLEMEWSEFETLHQRDISNYVARCCPKPGKPAGSGKLKVKGTWFKVKHCTSTPYLIQARIHSALNDGATLSPEGVPLDRFAIEIKRDKNSDAFLIDGKRDDREWLDVVPVRPDSKHIQRIEVLCKEKRRARRLWIVWWNGKRNALPQTSKGDKLPSVRSVARQHRSFRHRSHLVCKRQKSIWRARKRRK